MEPATILFTRPRKEGDPTSVTYEWCGKAIQMAREMGYNVIDIRGEDVTYRNVCEALTNTNPKAFIHFGHGCSTSLQGQRECIMTRKFDVDELLAMPNFRQIIAPLVHLSGCQYACNTMPDMCSPLCSNDTNLGLFKGKIVFAVACYSAEQLGKCSEKYGVESYCGYDELFLFPVDEMRSQDIFRDIQLIYIKELLKGNTPEQAERAMSKYEDALIKLHKRTKYLALSLLWNKLHRKVLGNRGALIYG